MANKAIQRPAFKTVKGVINVLITSNSNLRSCSAKAWIELPNGSSIELSPDEFVGLDCRPKAIPPSAKIWRGEQYGGREITTQYYWEGKAEIPV